MPVRLRSIESLRDEIHSLGCVKHRTRGNWSTGQIYFHLAAAFEASIDGASPGYPRWVRLLIRPFRSIVTQICFPPWLPIPKAISSKLAPPDYADCTEQHGRLLLAIDRFAEHEGVFPPHPVLGPLTRTEWIGFHLRHSQHHLSFIEQAQVP